MITKKSEEMIRLVTTYLNCSPDVVNDLISCYDAVDINYPIRGDLFLSTLGKVALVEYSYSGPPVLILKRKKQHVDSRLSVAVAVTVQNIYDRSVTIPDGYAFVSFRIPMVGDMIIENSPSQLVVEVSGDNPLRRYHSPRVIIRKVF